MKIHDKHSFSGSSKPKGEIAGFTLIELMTVIGVIAILGLILIPVVSRARESAKRSACASNLRQIGITCHLYANEHGGRLPELQGNQWMWSWDVSLKVMNDLIRTGEGSRDMFFCPAGPIEDRQELWEFGVTNATDESEEFRVIGYVLLFSGALRVPPEYTNERLSDPVLVPVGSGEDIVFESIPASQRDLAVDAVLSTGGGADASFAAVQGSTSNPDRTNHLSADRPLGGNILFMDGHVEWRGFEQMTAKVTGYPHFWW